MNITTKTKKLFAFWSGAFIVRKCISSKTLLGLSHIAIVTPILGSFLSLSQTCSALVGLTLFKYIFTGLPITLGIPSIAAALSWSASKTINKSITAKALDLVIHVLLPITCMALFVSHPIGKDAWPYASYWLVPIALWTLRTLSNHSSSFIFALQSTFVAHALGSVIFLYALPSSAAQWLALIPVVAIERLIMASMMSLMYETAVSLVAAGSFVKNKLTNPFFIS